MNRKETTLFLSHILERTKLNVFGKHYAKEVSIDPWTSNAKRVDYMQFSPGDQMSISGIEKGIFTCYEIKSCKEEAVEKGNNRVEHLKERDQQIGYEKIFEEMQMNSLR